MPKTIDNYTKRMQSMSPFDRMVYWMKTREEVRILKEKGATPPWTTDPIIANYRFCNVRRMDDKVSKWLYENWYKPNYNHKNMLYACVLARHFNRISTLDKLGFPEQWSRVRMLNKLVDITLSGDKVFSSAYIIRGVNGVPKVEAVIDHLADPLYKRRFRIYTDNMQDAVEQLCEIPCLGSFMSGQIVADMRWANEGKWKDRNTWAAMGPGSKRGMNRLMERPIEGALKQEQFLEELRALMAKIKESGKVPAPLLKKLEAIDYQSVLCETDKFNRILYREGKMKQKYHAC